MAVEGDNRRLKCKRLEAKIVQIKYNSKSKLTKSTQILINIKNHHSHLLMLS